MYFHVSRDVYLVFFDNELIVLDTKVDRYILLSKDISEILIFSLSYKFKLENGKYILLECKNPMPQNFDLLIHRLKEMRILSTESHSQPFKKIPQKKVSTGVDNIDWRMSFGDLNKRVSKLTILKAYLTLIKVYFVLKVLGFSALIHCIQNIKKENCVKQDLKAFTHLVVALNKACFLFPVRTKCLEWAAALTLMGLKKGWICNLEVGVQATPFLAHAWVRAGDNVIADSKDLPKMLSVILSEPF